MEVSIRRRQQQRGSALLIVLVFAAVIAIMLYRELPIAAFEAQRQREELLVARGNEYKRGVKLFVRKVGRFPSSIEELESTNRMRFLRHKYVDPLTGKDDWRMIHAGPGGIIIDSKVATPNNNKNSNALGQGATFSGFNNSFTGDTAAAAEAAAENTPSAGQRQRPPATKNAANAATSNDPLAAIAGTGDSADSNNASASSGNAANLFPTPQNNPGNGVTTVADQLNVTNPPQQQQAPPQLNSGGGLGNTSSFGNNNSGVFGNNTNSAPGNNNQQNGAVGTNPGNGQITVGGGIAGVASIAEGKGIKLVNDQKKYKLWEFYYDLRKEQTAGAPGLGQGQNANGVNGQQGQQGQSAFGNGSSSFGSGSSAFGSGSNQTGPPQLPVPQPQPQQQP